MDNNIIEQLAQQVKEEYGIEGDIREALEQAIRNFAVDIKQREERDKQRTEVRGKLEPILDEYGHDLVEDLVNAMVGNTLDY